MSKHAKLGPSSSDIWLTCLQAPAEWATRPPREAGFAAREGTLAHTLCEAAHSLGGIPWKEGVTFNVEGTFVEVTADMLNAVQLYLHVTSLISDLALWRIIEKVVDFGWLWGDAPPDEELFGTSDFAAADDKVLYVVDFKYGRGKVVKVEGNSQLLIYGLGAYGQLRSERPDLAASIEQVCLVIVQPRAGGEAVRQWTIPLEELLYWGYSTLKPAVDKIMAGKPLPLVPGNHCFFCAASGDCSAYHRLRIQASIASFPATEEEPIDMI